MSVKTLENINVYNYRAVPVIISTRDDQHTLEPAIDGNPSVLPLSPKEVEYINGSCKIFRTGGLRFDKELQEEIYEWLRIRDWESILFEETIEDILLNPTIEKLQKILDINHIGVIERVKGVLTRLKGNSATASKISTHVNDVVQKRYSEITHNKTTTDIVLTPRNSTPVDADDVDKLKKQNATMSQELLEVKEMLRQMLESTAQTKSQDANNRETESPILPVEPSTQQQAEKKTTRARSK